MIDERMMGNKNIYFDLIFESLLLKNVAAYQTSSVFF